MSVVTNGLILLILCAAITTPTPCFANGQSRPSQVTFSKAIGASRSDWVLETFDRYRQRSTKYTQDYFVFVDLKKHINKRRFYIVYPHDDKAFGYKVSHGYGSDKNRDGYIEQVGDVKNSGMNSEGVFLTLGIRPSSKFKKSIHLCGLSKTNRLAQSRLFRVHPAKDDSGEDYLDREEHSAGCFAINLDVTEEIYQLIGRQPTLIISSFTDSFE